MSRVFYISSILLLTILFVNANLFSQIHIPPGEVSGTWYKASSPYLIDGEIRIAYGDSLVIEPDVKVIFTGHYKLIVNGILEAIGNERDSIYFFPSDTSVGWHGLRFIEAEDVSNLQYCILEYGKSPMQNMFTKPASIIIEEFDSESFLVNSDDFTPFDSNNLILLIIKAIDDGDKSFNKYWDYFGGAIFAYRSNPEVKFCTIKNNTVLLGGGGIVCFNHSDPLISYCRIFNNSTVKGRGGGIYCLNYSNPEIVNCKITGNRAGHGGGLSCSNYSSPLIENCYIEGNIADSQGGGIDIQNYSNPLIDSCVVRNNVGGTRGGGISFYTSAKPIVQNSIIYGNYSPLGGGIYIDEFYNEYREQIGKIDIKLTNVRIANNSAEYGGGLWIRDTMGELINVTICNNRAIIGGGVHIEHNPHLFKFSEKRLCNVYMNFAKIMGNDFFRLGGEVPLEIQLDTFTVQHYSALNAEPVEKFPLTIRNFKLAQVNADLYVNPEGNDSNSGLSTSDPLKSLKIALLKILADSSIPRTIYMDEGEYIFSETNDVLMLEKHKYVSLKGMGFSEVIFSTDRITVSTPWWITTWALIIYAFTLVSVILIIWNVRMRRVKINSELEKERFEAEKLHEVDEMKSRFFANLSHEFRTPLTLIFGPAKDIVEDCDDKKAKQKAGIIKRNATRLYGLVNQLLDLSKLEAGKMKLEASEQNIMPLLKGFVLSFSSLAERKRITLKFNTIEENLNLYFDKDKVEKIVNNLLSNAFKFTPEGGKIDFTVEKLIDDAEIRIADNGIGIAKERMDKIFDRFYQVDGSHTRESEGTGIGLALTKELVELHKGKIEVESEFGKGTTLKILLPLGKEHLKPEELVEKEIKEDVDATIEETDLVLEDENRKEKTDIDALLETDKPLLLIVEDNSDVRKYIISHLEDDYRIHDAVDGEDGLQEALKQIPDLIISDIMMPKMDGFELCEKLKTDERTSHIPVILLTAKATNQDKIEGLETGADDYIMKPFDAEVLKARIKNLIEQRKKLREHFKKDGLIELEDKEITSIDKKFLEKIVKIIYEHLSDTSFSVDMFAEEVSMSRRNLDRKLIALTGESPSDIIKRVRLTRASQLLTQRSGNISEIALEVGFSNPAYFSKCFREQFGLTPSDYETNHSL